MTDTKTQLALRLEVIAGEISFRERRVREIASRLATEFGSLTNRLDNAADLPVDLSCVSHFAASAAEFDGLVGEIQVLRSILQYGWKSTEGE